MNFANETPYQAFWSLSYGKDGRERLIVVIKATYELVENTVEQGATPELELAEEQIPLVEADEFEGDAATSAPLHETDFAHFKPYCDILLNGCAYSNDKPYVDVALQIGDWSKGFRVVGPRVWRQRFVGIEPGKPEPFERLPISYGNAYGGTEANPSKPDQGSAHPQNPVGVGFHPYLTEVDGRPVPNTEDPRQAVKSPKGSYTPMAFGPIGRSWQPRPQYAGTYDNDWTTKRAPYLPDDFDDRYFQAAPPDQQIPYCQGGERVTLMNLTASRRMSFIMPSLKVPVLFVPKKSPAVQQYAVVDTISILPERQALCLTARSVFELRRNIFELSDFIVGGQKRSWLLKERYELSGKRYYRSLAEIGKKPDNE